MMHQIPRLDLMIAYSCNISCTGCISLSNFKRSGIEPFEYLVKSIEKWKTVLNPKVIAIFGGEPCLHPELMNICAQVRQAWPESTIRLITNGYLLENFDSASWFDFEPFELQVSIHRKDHESVINEKIKNILQQRQSWKVKNHREANQHRQISWTHGNFFIYKSIFGEFVVPYKKISNQFLPWHSDPAQAHKICGSPNSPILYKGLLYKCPPVANVIDLTGENWFNYHAIDVVDDVKTFVDNIGKPESVCGQCPESSQAVVINHLNLENVVVKHKNIS